MDTWLRRIALIAPTVTFIFGFGSGVMSTYLMFRDHERRIASLEVYRDEHQEFTRKYVTGLETLLAELKTNVAYLKEGKKLR